MPKSQIGIELTGLPIHDNNAYLGDLFQNQCQIFYCTFDYVYDYFFSLYFPKLTLFLDSH
jgi:hypothetical protein